MKIFVRNKSIVTPGDLIAEGNVKISGTYIKEGNKYYATTVSLVERSNNSIKLVPLTSIYIPKKEDLVIGKIIEVLPTGWQVDINSPYIAFLALKEALSDFVDITRVDLSEYYNVGEYIFAKVINVTKRGIVHVSVKGPGLKKIREGLIISITPSKVPRVIGKKGSMIQMMKQITGCNIIVGQNGRIWIKGEKPEIEALVAEAIRIIERASHISGLTEKIKSFLESEINKLKK